MNYFLCFSFQVNQEDSLNLLHFSVCVLALLLLLLALINIIFTFIQSNIHNSKLRNDYSWFQQCGNFLKSWIYYYKHIKKYKKIDQTSNLVGLSHCRYILITLFFTLLLMKLQQIPDNNTLATLLDFWLIVYSFVHIFSSRSIFQ